MRIALLALVACGSSPSPPPRELLTAPPLRTTPHDPTKATLAGRVLLDGKPMKRFVVKVGRARHIVSDAKGHFAIPHLEPDTVDITIAGPGFATRRFLGRELRAGETLGLGDIAVTHGFTIQGHVHDEAGQPLGGATVSIERHFTDDRDDASRWLDGHQTTTTDERGVYRFTDVAATSGAHVVAWFDDLVSEIRALPMRDATVDLVAVSSGALDVTSEVDGGWVSVWPQTRRARMQGVEPIAGVYHFDRLLPDTYEVRATTTDGFAAPLPQPVKVVAGRRASITLRAPATPIRVELATSLPCEQVSLDIERTQWRIATQRCESGTAMIEGVTPGHYQACDANACQMIRVLPAPAQQAFDLR